MRAFKIMALVGLAVLFGAPPAQAKTASYTATLSPDEEVPTKGPAGASGTAKVDINTDTNQVCYELTPSGLSEPPSAGHIHTGAKGASGPVYIDFAVPTNGLKNCVTSEAAKVSAVTANPSGYYVNIHTASYAAGAIRGATGGGGQHHHPARVVFPSAPDGVAPDRPARRPRPRLHRPGGGSPDRRPPAELGGC
jgi:CHRD domain.